MFSAFQSHKHTSLTERITEKPMPNQQVSDEEQRHQQHQNGHELTEDNSEICDQTVLNKWKFRIEVVDSFGQSMKRLKVSGKDLEHLPQEIFFLAELEILDLSPERESCLYYRLGGTIPPEIGNLTNLRVLMLDTNDLKSLPPELSRLTSLERLSLSNNHLSSLQEGFGALKNLKSLHCANNRLSEFPEEVCELESLEFLDFSDNLIETLPTRINRLRNLQTLLLYGNRLQALPDTICELVQLRCLWIGKNGLRQLPRQFGELRDLDWGGRGHTYSTVIDGNPMSEPPLEVCKQGIGAVRQYFSHNSSSPGIHSNNGIYSDSNNSLAHDKYYDDNNY